AYLGFLTAYNTQLPWLGFLAGAGGGMAVAALMAILCVWLGVNQVVVGIALTLGAEGSTALLHHVQFAQSYPRLPAVPTLALPVLSSLPVIGPALFERPAILYCAVLLVPLTSALFRFTHAGIALQAAGDQPAALDSAGVDVYAVRSAAVLATGVF